MDLRAATITGSSTALQAGGVTETAPSVSITAPTRCTSTPGSGRRWRGPAKDPEFPPPRSSTMSSTMAGPTSRLRRPPDRAGPSTTASGAGAGVPAARPWRRPGRHSGPSWRPTRDRTDPTTSRRAGSSRSAGPGGVPHSGFCVPPGWRAGGSPHDPSPPFPGQPVDSQCGRRPGSREGGGAGCRRASRARLLPGGVQPSGIRQHPTGGQLARSFGPETPEWEGGPASLLSSEGRSLWLPDPIASPSGQPIDHEGDFNENASPAGGRPPLALPSSGIQVAPDIPGVLDIGHRKQLFIDGYSVESMEPRVYRLMLRPAADHHFSRLSRFRVALRRSPARKASSRTQALALAGHSGTVSMWSRLSRHPPYPPEVGVLVESRCRGWVHTHKV